jgi:FMN reductase
MTSARPALRVVAIGGTTRAGSTTECALRQSLGYLENTGARTRLFDGRSLAGLPMYSPERAERAPLARDMVAALRDADAVVIASPGYHGAVSGLLKNALDYIEDLRETQRPYLSGLPVGCIATGSGWQGVIATLHQLRTIVHALRGWPTPLGVAINTAETGCDAAGRFTDERTAACLQTLAAEVGGFAAIRTVTATEGKADDAAHAGRIPAQALCGGN